MRTYAREKDEIWKEQFSGVLSHDLYWENKTYQPGSSQVNIPAKPGGVRHEIRPIRMRHL